MARMGRTTSYFPFDKSETTKLYGELSISLRCLIHFLRITNFDQVLRLIVQDMLNLRELDYQGLLLFSSFSVRLVKFNARTS